MADADGAVTGTVALRAKLVAQGMGGAMRLPGMGPPPPGAAGACGDGSLGATLGAEEGGEGASDVGCDAAPAVHKHLAMSRTTGPRGIVCAVDCASSGSLFHSP